MATLREILRVERLGKNHGGYHGEMIDIRAVLRDIQNAAQTHGWSPELFHTDGGFKWFALHRKPDSLRTPHSLPRRSAAEAGALRVYISTGIHGDEPAGPLAVLRLIRENRWPEDARISLVPCLNPAGFAANSRLNAGGVDLNRDYRNPRSAEVRAHIAWLEWQPEFDFYLCLHEDWEARGFYLYEQNPDARPSLAEKIVKAVEKVCPIDPSETIEDRPARNGIIRPNLKPHDRPDWPEAFYLITNKSRQGYTLEAPSDYLLAIRVNALVAAVNAALGI